MSLQFPDSSRNFSNDRRIQQRKRLGMVDPDDTARRLHSVLGLRTKDPEAYIQETRILTLADLKTVLSMRAVPEMVDLLFDGLFERGFDAAYQDFLRVNEKWFADDVDLRQVVSKEAIRKQLLVYLSRTPGTLEWMKRVPQKLFIAYETPSGHMYVTLADGSREGIPVSKFLQDCGHEDQMDEFLLYEVLRDQIVYRYNVRLFDSTQVATFYDRALSEWGESNIQEMLTFFHCLNPPVVSTASVNLRENFSEYMRDDTAFFQSVMRTYLPVGSFPFREKSKQSME